MRSPSADGTLVVSLRSPRRARGLRVRGFTILEAQVALLVFVIAASALIGYGRAYKQLLVAVESEHRLDGVATPSADRVVVTVTSAAEESPRCELELQSIETDAGAMQAEVLVTRRPL